MATGASGSDAAIILIDARKGVSAQSRRHAVICSMLGIRHVVLAVNKMDLVDYAQATFDRIVEDFRDFAAQLSFTAVDADPDVGAVRRQRRRARPQHGLVRRPAAARVPRIDRGRHRARGAAVPVSGAMGEPAGPGVPRLCRHGCQRPYSPRRSGPARPHRRCDPDRADRHRRRRHRGGRGRRRGHADAHRRSRRRARRSSGIARPAAGGRRPIRRAPDLDERRAAAARALLPHADRQPLGAGDGVRDQAQARRHPSRAARRAHPRHQRDRPVQPRAPRRRWRSIPTRSTARPAPSSSSTVTPTRRSAPE